MKGIIVETDGRYAVLLNDKGEFKKIKNNNYISGQKIVYKEKSPVYYALCACAAMFCFFSATAYALSITPVAYVDVDINPSLRLEVNCFDRVIKCYPLNYDAEKIVRDIKKGKVVDYLNNIIEVSIEKGYINEEHSNVEIDVASRNDKLYKEVKTIVSKIKTITGTDNVELYSRDKACYSDALQRGVSMGRLSALKEYAEVSGETMDDATKILMGKKVCEIKQYTKELELLFANVNIIEDDTVNKSALDISNTTEYRSAKEKGMINNTDAPHIKDYGIPKYIDESLRITENISVTKGAEKSKTDKEKKALLSKDNDNLSHQLECVESSKGKYSASDENEFHVSVGNEKPEQGVNEKPEQGVNEKPEQGGNEKPEQGGNEKPEQGGNEKPEQGGNEKPEQDGNEMPKPGRIENTGFIDKQHGGR